MTRRGFFGVIAGALAGALAAPVLAAVKPVGAATSKACKVKRFGDVACLGHATGGPVNASKPYIIGGDGPELFVPSQHARVMRVHVGKELVWDAEDPSVGERSGYQTAFARWNTGANTTQVCNGARVTYLNARTSSQAARELQRRLFRSRMR